MTFSNKQPDDFQADVQDDFQADDFQPENPKKNKLKDLSYLEQNFTLEGRKLKKEASQNLLKGTLSGATAGYSELIPGLEVEENGRGSVGKLHGSLIPLGAGTKLASLGTNLLAKQYPKLAKPITALGNLIGISASGGIYEGLEESAEKTKEAGEFVPPSVDTILEQGAIWGALDVGLKALGWGGRFTKELLRKSSELKVPATELLENISQKLKGTTDKIAEKAMSILEGKPLEQIEKEALNPERTKNFSQESILEQTEQRSADLRNKKISQEDFHRIGAQSQIKMQPYLPEQFSATEIAENAINEDLAKRIESTGQRPASDKQFGESIKNDIERTVQASKKETDALYEIASEGVEGKYPSVKETAESIVEQINKLKSGEIKLKPEGYARADRMLRDTLSDLGYALEESEGGAIIGAIEESRQPLSRVIEVKKRLNNVINYDLLDTSAQDFLKDPASKLRGEIRQGYGPKNSPARKAFEEAESMFGEFAEKKGKKSIRAIRTSEKPETIAKLIKTPSGLADVKAVVSDAQFAQVERELLEHMKTLDEGKAAGFYREIRESLNSDARSIAEEIIQDKSPKPNPSRKAMQHEAIQKKAIDDIAQATITGERPEKALNLWKTKEGQQLIKHALADNPNKAEVLKYLEEQSFKDFYSSVVSADGTIEFKKLDKMLKDPATVDNIRLVAGEEGVNFLKNLESLSNKVKKNASIIEGRIDKGSSKERELIKKELDKHGERILEKTKEKNIAQKNAVKDRFGNVIEESIGKKSASNRESLKKQSTIRGEEKFQERIQTKKAQEEALEKSKVLYKFDEFLSNYGVKTKGLLAGLGILKYGTVEGIGLALSYEAFSRIARNKKVQQAFRKAAMSNSSPSALIKSLTELMDELDQ